MPIPDVPPPCFADINWTGITRRYLNPGELEILVGLIESRQAKIVIEIGVNDGRNPQVLLARENAVERYFGIDVPPSYRPALRVQAHEVPARPGHLVRDPRFELILRPNGSLDLTPADLPEADVVFIDGDHGAKAVLHDTMLAQSIVRPGGLIIWHDYHDLGNVDVKSVLDALQIGLERAGKTIQHIEGTWLCIQEV